MIFEHFAGFAWSLAPRLVLKELGLSLSKGHP